VQVLQSGGCHSSKHVCTHMRCWAAEAYTDFGSLTSKWPTQQQALLWHKQSCALQGLDTVGVVRYNP
jgi:hypothetical protein